MIKSQIKALSLLIFLTSGIAIPQTKKCDFQFFFRKHLDSLMLSNTNIFLIRLKLVFKAISLRLFSSKNNSYYLVKRLQILGNLKKNKIPSMKNY